MSFFWPMGGKGSKIAVVGPGHHTAVDGISSSIRVFFSGKINWGLVILKMLTKKQVLYALKNMPDTFDTIQLFDRILLIDKVEEGRQQMKCGKGLSTEEVTKTLKKWLK